jgi:polar amino acid transport system substrate-binding protein
MDDYLSKPLLPQSLEEAISRHVRPGPPPLHEVLSPTPEDKGAPLWKVLRERFGSEESAVEVMEVFLCDAAAQVKSIRDSAAAGELAEVTAQSHALKGAAASVFAGELESLARQVERNSCNGDAESVRSALPLLETAFASFKELVKVKVSARA